MKKIALTYLVLFSLLILPAGCGEKVKPGVAEVKREQISGLTVSVVGPSTVDEFYETSGTVRAKTVSVAASRMMGAVTSIKVKEGDRVKAGQALLTIDDSDVAQKVKAAAEGYREAEKAVEAAGENKKLNDITYQRYRKLFDEKALSGQELDRIETQQRVAGLDYERAQAALKRAEAGVSEAKVYHGFTRITAPLSGLVTEKKIEYGSMAVPGMPLITVEDDSSYRIEVNADETQTGRIRPGMNALVTIESLNRGLTGTVSEVVPSVDPMSRTFLVKISLKAEGLRNGLYARVSIPAGKKQALLVPGKAVAEKGQLTGIFVVSDKSVITYRLVRLGRTYGDRVEILSGLTAGDRVVIGGVEKAVDGGVAVTAP